MEPTATAPSKNARWRFLVARPSSRGPGGSSAGKAATAGKRRPTVLIKICYRRSSIATQLHLDLPDDVRDQIELDTTSRFIDLAWYKPWLEFNLAQVPQELRQLRVGKGTFDDAPGFNRLFSEVGIYLRDNDEPSIDEIVFHLRSMDLLDSDDDILGNQRLVVFSILGWQSMVYLPAFNTCSTDELAIHRDSTQPQSGLIFDSYKISSDLADRPLYILLKAFGHLLPARSKQTTQVASENSKAAASWLPLYPAETNAYLLHTLLRVHIRWVDTLSLHLDYDQSSRTLSLFSSPSFCVAMLQSPDAIQAFAGPGNIVFDADPRASREDLLQFLNEVLLSFRLLFGQSAPSRRLFRHVFEPPTSFRGNVDALLPLICATKRYRRPSEAIPGDRAIYFAARDFPILYERVELIAKELRDTRPKTMRDLFRDRRDTLQYWTFWLVALIGGIGIVLSTIQVVLQALSLYQ